MCELCSIDHKERQIAREGCARVADRFTRLARYYERLAAGGKPHDAKFIEAAKNDARFAAKMLVEEWL